jgi:hypothetical protein
METHRAVVKFEIEIDLSSFDEGNFSLRTFPKTFVKQIGLVAFYGADALCRGESFCYSKLFN